MNGVKYGDRRPGIEIAAKRIQAHAPKISNKDAIAMAKAQYHAREAKDKKGGVK